MFADFVCARLRSDGVTSKNVKLFGEGFLSLVEHYFLHLPLASMKQAHSVRQKANVTEEEWETSLTRWNQIIDEHETEGASEQLADGWKAWLAERGLQSAGQQGSGAQWSPRRAPKSLRTDGMCWVGRGDGCRWRCNWRA
jgi:hypothetical protein